MWIGRKEREVDKRGREIPERRKEGKERREEENGEKEKEGKKKKKEMEDIIIIINTMCSSHLLHQTLIFSSLEVSSIDRISFGMEDFMT